MLSIPIWLTPGAKGNVYIATPKNKTQQKKFEREVKKTGTIRDLDYEQAATGMSAITEEVVETTPAATAKKRTRNVRATDRKRRSPKRRG